MHHILSATTLGLRDILPGTKLIVAVSTLRAFTIAHTPMEAQGDPFSTNGNKKFLVETGPAYQVPLQRATIRVLLLRRLNTGDLPKDLAAVPGIQVT
jgi:hypothetical protein